MRSYSKLSNLRSVGRMLLFLCQCTRFGLFSKRLESSGCDVEPVNMVVAAYMSLEVSKVDTGLILSTQANYSHMASRTLCFHCHQEVLTCFTDILC